MHRGAEEGGRGRPSTPNLSRNLISNNKECPTVLCWWWEEQRYASSLRLLPRSNSRHCYRILSLLQTPQTELTSCFPLKSLKDKVHSSAFRNCWVIFCRFGFTLKGGCKTHQAEQSRSPQTGGGGRVQHTSTLTLLCVSRAKQRGARRHSLPLYDSA